jgi:hypothetical protein
MIAKKAAFVVAASAALWFTQNSANAQYGGWCGLSPWYTGYTSEYVPYYAMHPPVYYSYPVPRPYGYSPFAYPPGVLTPEILGEPTGPQEIINPHVVPKEKPTSTTNKTTKTLQGPVPQVVINPFVDPKLAGE